MRYSFFGRKIPHVGKPLWEILGNLKNFGVGRLIKQSGTLSDPEGVSFCRIVKVLPLPPFEKEYYSRIVTVWYDEVFRGQKKGIVKVTKFTDVPKFTLIPKIEEEWYLKEAEKSDAYVTHLKKYCPWPPLYKKIWEQGCENVSESIPKLNLKIEENEILGKVIEEDAERPRTTCSLYKSEQTVDEMYKEIVKLKTFIKSRTTAQQK